MRTATLEEVKNLLRKGFESAVGHESTAQLLTKLTGISIPMRRVSIMARPGDVIVHFALRTRLPEGRVLSEEELQQLQFDFVISEVHQPR